MKFQVRFSVPALVFLRFFLFCFDLPFISIRVTFYFIQWHISQVVQL